MPILEWCLELVNLEIDISVIETRTERERERDDVDMRLTLMPRFVSFMNERFVVLKDAFSCDVM